MDELRAMALAFQQAYQLSDAEMSRTIDWPYSTWNRFKHGQNVNQDNEEKLRIIVCGDRDAHLVPGFMDKLKDLLGELEKEVPNQAKILQIDVFCRDIAKARGRAAVVLGNLGSLGTVGDPGEKKESC